MFRFYRWLLLGLSLGCSGAAWALADPTRPASYQHVAGEQGLRLESVLISDSRKVAVINGHVVAEGDRIAGARIIHINRQGVKVSRDGVSRVLVMPHTSIRQEK